MIRRIQDGYIHATAVILLITALVKFFSAVGTAPIWDWLDPLLPFSNRHVFMLAGTLELGLSAFLFLGRERRTKILALIWLADIYLIYRLGLWWAGASNLVSCLANLTDKFSIAPAVLDQIIWLLLGWLLVGSHAIGLFQWFDNRTLKSNPAK